MNTAQRAALIAPLLARPPADVAPLREAFSSIVARQWAMYVPPVVTSDARSISEAQATKARFISEMYARACYSMLLLSANGPGILRFAVRAATMLPLSRGFAIRLSGLLLSALDRLVPEAVHRQLLLVSALVGTLDVVLDQCACQGEPAVLRIASLMTPHAPTMLNPAEQTIATLTRTIRYTESSWQSDYWEAVLIPAIQEYCRAEALAVAHVPDPKEMGHRWAGIDSVIKGMWYAVGPWMGLGGNVLRFENTEWNREQQWMADTCLLMQMIDDWVDQDGDSGERMTPVLTGDWNMNSVDTLYRKTVHDLAEVLTANRIRGPLLQSLFLDLYNDYLHLALEAMGTGEAA